ncbi:MAG: hypothetical protein B7Z66_00260 [Chromatiales bacterium 21-64-14]|nr:MAG: hypothetical protein B7Z66_00260 [Chromatiales bacterium 21-64-14]HQU16292.1 diguanylate cyclase [Gammaproteobacteria bacterium]
MGNVIVTANPFRHPSMQRAILDVGLDAMILVDIDGIVLQHNAAAETTLGCTPQALAGKTLDWVTILDGERSTSLAALVRATIESGRTNANDTQVRLVWPDRPDKSIHLRLLATFDPDGIATGAFLAFRDLGHPDSDNADENYHRNLARIARVITQTMDIRKTVRAVVRELLVVFQADRAWLIYPCDPDAASWGVLVEATHPDYPGAYAEGRQIPMDTTISAVMRKSLATPRAVTYEGPGGALDPSMASHFAIRSQIMTALRPKLDRPWLLGMHQCSRPRHWTDGEKRLVQDIGERLTDALTNQILVRRLEQDVARRKAAEAALNRALQEHKSLIDATPDIVFKVASNGRLVRWNHALEATTALRPDELESLPIHALFPEAERTLLEQAMRRALEYGQSETEITMINKEGIGVPYHWITVPVRDHAGNIGGLTGFGRNIAERKRSEQKLRQAAAVFETTLDGVVITDAETRIVAANTAFTAITGFAESEVQGRPPDMLGWDADWSHEDSIWARAARDGHWMGELMALGKTGRSYPARLCLTPVRDEEGRVNSYVAVFADITELKQSQKQLEHIAHHDALTGLPNRLMCHTHLQQAISTARDGNFEIAVLFIDLDDFKNVNDNHGHAFGDRILQDAAARLARTLRKDGREHVFRLGGDEFTIVLKQFERREEIIAVAQRTLHILSTPFSLGKQTIVLGASIGIGRFPVDATDETELLSAADTAMYQAKQLGKNTYQFYSADTGPRR